MGFRPSSAVTGWVVTTVLLLTACSSGLTPTTGADSSNATTQETSTTRASTTTIRDTEPTTTFASGPSGEAATVLSVTDGDTIRVDYEGADEAVRLIGINSPEVGECFYAQSSDALATLVDGRSVLMVADVSDRDQYGRLLRYLYLPDGTFVNEDLVRQGFALARDYPPDSGEADRLAFAQSEAESESLGLWAPDACGKADTSSGLRITEVVYDAPGDDNDNLNGEWVEITNQGSSAASMSGWVLKDESASHRYPFPNGFTLAAGASVEVFTGCGTDTTTDLYWCNTGSAVWNNGGDTAFLLDPGGNIHDEWSY